MTKTIQLLDKTDNRRALASARLFPQDETGKLYQILAPAGSQQALVCAVQNGADAVYFGLDKFNARMKADNFTSDNLCYWVNYCHLYGVKAYVALNTSIKQSEFGLATQMLQTIYSSNADGVILTDLALIKYAATFGG